jgi:hypothetical protein
VTGKWDQFSAYHVVREIVAQDPALLSAVVSGMTAGHGEALAKLKEEMAWANMAMDAALTLSTKRATPGNVELLNRCIAKRIESFGANTNGIEREYLAELKAAPSPASAWVESVRAQANPLPETGISIGGRDER